jgi:pimeloyl-ACP methyl ester carboxylesterase/uncharacterized protein (DUF362 family)
MSVVAEFQQQLEDWKVHYAGRPHDEMTALWLLALEREQLVTVAYRRDIIDLRLSKMPISTEVREAVARAIRWAWRDEEAHALYIRGVLLRGRAFPDRAKAWLTQLEGRIAGWTASRQNHLGWTERPVTRAVAEMLEVAGVLAQKIPQPARDTLQWNAFADFCRFNIDAERTAALGWERIAELANDPALDIDPRDRVAFQTIAEDEDRHARLFALFATAFDPQDRLVADLDAATLIEAIGEIGQRFLALPRPHDAAWENPLGKGATVHVCQGSGAHQGPQILRELLDSLALTIQPGTQVAIKPTFMMVTDRADRSGMVDVRLLKELGAYLTEQGATVHVLEGGNIYDVFHANRDVLSVARYLDVPCEHYEVLDAGTVQEPHIYARGLDQHSIAAPWRDADVRILFGKLRSHPTSMAMLSMEAAEGLAERHDRHTFGDRRTDRELTLAMLLDAFPPDLALVDAYSNVADGLLGMMGTETPRHPWRLYGSRDALSLDTVLARHVGASPEEVALVQVATDWFGDPQETLSVRGPDTPIVGWTPPAHSMRTALLQKMAMPVYAHASARGALFLPDFDTDAFPPLAPLSPAIQLAQRVVRQLTRDEPRFLGLLPTSWLQTEGGRVRMTRVGNGPPVVLLHGYPETLQLFSHLVPRLAEHYEVFAFDWPGQGYSERWTGPCDPVSRSRQLATLLDHFGLDTAHLVATDMGGHPALALASTQPDRVLSMVIMNSLLFGDGPTSYRIALMRRAGLGSLAFTRAPSVVYAQCKSTFLNSGDHWPGALDDDFLRAFRRKANGQFLAELCADVEASFETLPTLYWQLETPTLTLWGEREAHFPLEQAERFTALVDSARLSVVEGGGHWMPFTHAEAVAEAIHTFLSEAT